jgi:hypothetical protein
MALEKIGRVGSSKKKSEECIKDTSRGGDLIPASNAKAKRFMRGSGKVPSLS